MVRRRIIAVIVPAAVALAGAGVLTGCFPTPAGTVEVRSTSPNQVFFTAAAGKNNNVTVTRQPDGSVRVKETGGITPGEGCTRVDANTARCTTEDSLGLTVVGLDLADGNDTAVNCTADLRGTILGGAGNDTLTGGSSTDDLFGDEGTDTLNGGAGSDNLVEGLTAASADAVDADVFNGGPGIDLANYFRATQPVTIDIDDVADDGRPVEGDNVKTDVEDLRGGAQQDSLTGDGDANRLFDTGATADAIQGRGGDDRLFGGNGDDLMNGDEGDDLLRGEAGVDILAGGPGTDDCDVGANGGFETDCES